MKIIILQDDFPPKSTGGAGMVAFSLAQEMWEKGHSVFVITAVGSREEEGEVNYKGLVVYRLYSNYPERWRAYFSLYNPQVIKKIDKIFQQIKPDVVHAHNIHTHISYHSLKLAKKSGAKVFLTAHDAMLFHYGKLVEFFVENGILGQVESYRISPWRQIKKYKKRYNPFRNMVIRRDLKYVDQIFAVSGELKKALEDNGIKKIAVLRNGVDVSQWQIRNEKIKEFKNKFELNGFKVILFGGRLGALKGGEQAVKALGEVVKIIPQTKLLVVGRRDAYAELMLELAGKIGLKDLLVFTGWLDQHEMAVSYHASDVVCVPSIYLDPFPTVNLEAMACQKPVIGTCFGGTPELVQDNKTGFIVNPFCVNDLAEKISILLSDEKKAKEFGLAGYEAVSGEFGLKKTTAELLGWYDRLLKK